ncbi:hypothetical protein [Flavobacterium sp. 245]|uniref:hypothetical protein n=1 Tax=Flavobacterium sp. 245 TaxID=2512115 RepID=UPI00105EE7A8|nr:hypothetical protein [Flavobacterium sp. 245]TDO99097.1 hypothetical protein EV145_1074 [Flavobacterium sp. 245]
MKKRSLYATTLLLLLITMSSFVLKNNANEQVMIYGLVYSNRCNTETYEFFSHKLVDASNYYQEEKDLETTLKSKYPNAKRIRVGSSKFDFGKSASNMCVIKWAKENNNCGYDVVSVHFGTTEADALNRAIKHKNLWAGSNASYTILMQKYW